MNKVAVGIVSGIGGCTIGSVATYFILNKRLKAQYDKDVREAKAYFANKRYNGITTTDVNDTGEYNNLEEAYEQYTEVREQIQEQSSEEKVTIDDTNYDRQRIIESLDYHSKYGPEKTEEDKEFEEAEKERSIAEDSYSPVWVVTGDEYYDTENNNLEFDRSDLIYLPEDDVLIAANGDVYADDKLEKYRRFIDQDAVDGELFICDSDYREYYRINIDDRDYVTYMADLE